MATVNKDFKVKNGLIVEGTTAKVNNFDILTKKQADQDYIVGLIGGTATSANTPDTVVKRDGSGNFAAGTITASITGNVTGNVTGTVSDISNHDTGDLAEGSRLYFTNQRAIDANTGLWDTIGAAAAAQTAASNALNSAVEDLEAYADQAEVDAKAYTDTREIAITSAYQSYADTAEADAKAYTDTRETAITNAYQSYADTAEADAKSYADGIVGTVSGNLSTHEQATTGVHGVTGNIVGTTDTQTLSNKTLGSDLAAGGYKVTGLLNPSANQDAATKSYVDTAVADLVNGAPELLDTLNELAAAIGDDENFITTVTASIGEKVAKAGDSMSGDLDFGGTSKVTSLAAPTNSGDAATKGYVDGQISTLDTAAQGYADDAETAANLYTDGRETAITTAYEAYADQAESDAVTAANSYTDDEITTALSTAQGYANTAEQNAKDYADDLTTSDIAEGTNLYFTNQRAIDAVGGTISDQINLLDTDDIEEGTLNLYHTDARAKASAANLLLNASLTNIAITGNSTTGLIIAAENGVADSTTTDLAEGTNLYFTNARAVTALEAVVPNFTEVDINSLATQVAATVSVPTASSSNVAYSFAHADYRSAEFLVKTAYGNHTEISKVLLTLDTSNNIAMTEYGIVGTNGASMTVSADIDGTNARLLVTTANNSSTITVVGTLLK